MAISPFSARPVSPRGEGGRSRLALAIAFVGIVAILLVYAISPGVRHAVSHAEHSVKHAFDPDRAHERAGHGGAGSRTAKPAPAKNPASR